MSSKYFRNAFIDFSPNVSKDIIEDDEGKPNIKIIQGTETFWKKTSNLFQNIDPDDCTVYTGSAGIALLFLRKSQQNPELLKESLKYLNLDKLKNRRVTFLCGDAGPLAIGAVIYDKLKNKEESAKLVDRLIDLSSVQILNPKSDLPNELLYGRAGYLYALLYVNANMAHPPIDDKLIKKVISMILQIGKHGARAGGHKVPLMYDWHNKHYLGAAHGLSGVLYILLQAKDHLTKSELNELLKPTIDYLMKMRYSSGNFMSSLENDSDRLVQWCHGAPGFTKLFCQAYDIFKDEQYLKVALECGDIVWNRGLLRKGYSICHGVAGNGYTFLELFQTTKDSKHLYRAIKFAEWCIQCSSEHEEHQPDRPLSLFEGIAGRLYFLEDIKDPLNAKFPAYTI